VKHSSAFRPCIFELYISNCSTNTWEKYLCYIYDKGLIFSIYTSYKTRNCGAEGIAQWWSTCLAHAMPWVVSAAPPKGKEKENYELTNR
jgi:hypothetical protein